MEILDDECAAPNVFEEGDERVGWDEVVELDEDGHRDQADAVPRSQQFRAASVVLIIGVEQGDERAGVDYERNGWGS